MSARPSISIVGFGRVGKALYASLKEAGYTVHSVYSRSHNDIPEYKGGTDSGALDLGDLAFITFSDNVLPQKAGSYRDTDHPNTVFVHCSGSYSSALFTSIENGKGSFHPMQAITEQSNSFKGIWFDLEGDDKARETLSPISKDLGIQVLTVSPEAKVFLHAASVFASNYVVALLQTAAEVAEKGGISKEEAISALLPLMRSAIANIEQEGLDKALTGPVDRAESNTVNKHLSALTDDPEVRELYRLLAKASLPLSKSTDNDALNKLKDLLDE